MAALLGSARLILRVRILVVWSSFVMAVAYRPCHQRAPALQLLELVCLLQSREVKVKPIVAAMTIVLTNVVVFVAARLCKLLPV